jgi:hypothetical protein
MGGSFANRACLHFSNASVLAAVMPYGLRGLPDFVDLTGVGVPASMVDANVLHAICEDCRREIASQHLLENMYTLLAMSSKEDAFIHEHLPSAMPARTACIRDVYDGKLFPDMNSTIYRMGYVLYAPVDI